MLKTSGTVDEVLDVIGSATGISSREKQLAHLNRMRQWVYAEQERLGIDLTMPLCVPVTKYRIPCSGRCSDKFRMGFRLPCHYQSIEVVEYSGEHAELFSRSRTPFDGISIGTPFDGTEGVKIYKRDLYPLEFDLEFDSRLRFRWISIDKNNPETTIRVKGWGPSSEKIEADIILDSDGAFESKEVFREISHVQFIGGLKGDLTIETENGDSLGTFGCGDKPGFRQYEVLSPFCITRLRIHANLRYRPVTDGNELVEFGETLVWELLAKYLHALLKEKRDAQERASMAEWLSTLVSMIRGEQNVEDGNIDMSFQRASLFDYGIGLESSRR